MGHLKISHLIDGTEYTVMRFDGSNERILNAFALHDKYNWRLIQEIPFDGPDLSLIIELAGKEAVDWSELGVPLSVITTIDEVQRYQDAYNEVERLSRATRRASVRFAYEIRSNANRILSVFENLKLSDLVDNNSLDQQRKANALRHTITQEVGALCRTTSKDSKRRQAEVERDVDRHLPDEIDDIRRCLHDIKLK